MEEKKDKKGSLFSVIVNAIALLAVILFVLLLFFSYNNFTDVKNGHKPTGYKDVDKYVKDGKEITVYNYMLYKIVIIKDDNNETYMLKPIFVKNY